MKSENRRTFVKKTFAATAALSFAGLIRAHGEDPGGEETTIGTFETTALPWGMLCTWPTVPVESASDEWIEGNSTFGVYITSVTRSADNPESSPYEYDTPVWVSRAVIYIESNGQEIWSAEEARGMNFSCGNYPNINSSEDNGGNELSTGDNPVPFNIPGSSVSYSAELITTMSEVGDGKNDVTLYTKLVIKANNNVIWNKTISKNITYTPKP